MRILCTCLLLTAGLLYAQTAPTFRYTAGGKSYTLVGSGPAKRGATSIPVVLAPILLSFAAERLDATPDMPKLLRSPIFSPFAFPTGGSTQFADAMLHATFPKATGWRTILGKPEVIKTVSISVPASYGYVLTSKKSRSSLAVVDIEFLQRELFKEIGKQEGKLVIAVTRNTTYYTEGDATLCCSWGTYGVDSGTGDSFVLASYLAGAPPVVEDQDVQPVTQQLAEFINDPLHDPLVHQRRTSMPGNQFPAWMRPASMRPADQGPCGGTRVASAYFLLEPTDANHKNNVPASPPFAVHGPDGTYHVQNVALLRWYLGPSKDLGDTNSFPDPRALVETAKSCPAHAEGQPALEAASQPPSQPAPTSGLPNNHRLIGYWAGYGPPGSSLRGVAAQWDIVIVAFATPAKDAPEGTLRFQPPGGSDSTAFKADVGYLQARGKKVMISLGGGGQYFSLADSKDVPNFVASVSNIIREYGFDGIDIDFESPSLLLDEGDADFTHPSTPSIVNLIAGVRRLRTRFGSRFMISLVPEGPQYPAGSRTYGGQFGSYLPLAYGIRDILSFIDVQDYNTPPLAGLDGEIYQAGTVDYHAAVTELVVQGFRVAGNPKRIFPPIPADRVAVGFLIGETTPNVVTQAMDYLIAGKAPAGVKYKLFKASGYPALIGAMFWTIDADRLANYEFSNPVGMELHGYRRDAHY
jgi:chitinase